MRCCPISNAPRPTKACRTTTTAPTGCCRSAKTATATRSAWRLSAPAELNLPYRNDFNGDSQHGVGFYQTTTHNGERASTARTYLKAVRDERRLVVKLNALAHRLTFEGNVATGVVYSQNGGAEVTARATKEVIVSAGAVGSPKLLMLSGIGPRDHLQQLGIEVRADLPVGKTSTTICTCRSTSAPANRSACSAPIAACRR